MSQTTVIVLLAILSCGFAQVPSFGVCPKWDTQKNFNVTQYVGTWYEIKKYPAIFQLFGTCAEAIYTPKNGSIEVHNSMCVAGNEISIIGSAHEANPGMNDGKLKVNFPNTGDFDADYWVLHTDYKNLSLVASCAQITDKTNVQFAWVLSRTPELTTQLSQEVDRLIAAFNLNKTVFITTNQTKCCNRNSGASVCFSMILLIFAFIAKLIV